MRTCPSCGRPIAERKTLRCLYCANEIPADHHFTAQEQAAMDREEEEVRMFELWRKLQDLREPQQLPQLPPAAIIPPTDIST